MCIRKMLLCFLMLLSSSVFAFAGKSDTCQLNITTSPSTQKGGLYVTAVGTLNVLCVYIQFPDDNWQPSNSNWSKGQAPIYMDATVDASWSATPTSGGITDFFNQMSFNTLKITGTEVSVITPKTRKWYLENGWTRPDIQVEVLKQLDVTIDFAQFDNWHYISPYSHTNTSDGIVDMIWMMWRNIDADTTVPITVPPTPTVRKQLGLEPGGEASLGYYSLQFSTDTIRVDGGARTIKMGYGSGSGITAIQPKGSDLSSWTLWRYTRHEFSHWLLGGMQYHTQIGTWGLLSSWGTPSDVINSFERERLAWINLDSTTITDVSTTRTISSITIPDFVTTGIAYRIQVPGGSPYEFYLLENHQRISAFDIPDANSGTAKGLFVLYQEYNAGDGTSVISADGRFNWSVPARSPNNWGSGYLPVFRRESSNRVNGYGKRQSIPWYWQGVYQGAAAIHYYIN